MMIRKTPTILVVEDDPESRTAMLKVLEGAEYKTMEADNGQLALDLILEGEIDILVTDLRLPVMDGVELLKRAKAAEQEIEVILITGHGTVEVAVEAIKEGAYDFITKPVKKAQLLRAVERPPRSNTCSVKIGTCDLSSIRRGADASSTPAATCATLRGWWNRSRRARRPF